MTVIRLRELAQRDNGDFRIRVSFDDEAEYQVTVTDPADEAVENNIAWYFENHLRYPFLDKDKEQRAVGQIAEYGQSLFRQVFGGEASHDYRNLKAESFDGCRIEVSGSAALHRLHWEALEDPDLATPLSVRMPVARRVSDQPSRFALRKDLPTLNILVVTARPDGPRDVGYRTISRPLIDALRTAGLPVTVDQVRPGTWQALRDHLLSATERRGSGWYHVIHFDMHGAFSEYGPLAAGRQSGRLQFSHGLFSEFQGQRGFLYFETDQDSQAEPIPAEALADLLEEHRVPVAILNACQSAMQSTSEAGLAQRLAEAGVPVALGMAYSVTVSAAVRAMPVLYRRIVSGDELAIAVTAARRELRDHRARQAYFGHQLELEDWLLPVMFRQRRLHIQLRDMTGEEYERFHERQASVADEPSTEYGFVGRDLDIQAIERKLLARPDSNELLVHGMAGAGKSTLLNHLAWWWQRTNLVERVFPFSYEERAWTSNQIVREIRQQLTSPADNARSDRLSEDAQAEQVAGLLRANRHLLILDNAESITATPAAIPHSLDAENQGKLKRLLARLRGGRTLVLLGSRESEKWLTTGQGPGTYSLPGLDGQAASLLVDRILDRYGAKRWLDDELERQALEEVVTLLGGYPLPLTVVLPVLASAAPSVVLGELQSGDLGADPAGLITRAIEYSHGKLDPALQDSLQLLAPFTAAVPTGEFLASYQELLLADPQLLGMLGSIDLVRAANEATGVGLAVSHPQVQNLLQVQPVLPWFLRNRLLSRPELAAVAYQAHYQLYLDTIAPALHAQMTSPHPDRRTAGFLGAQAHYANLRTALNHALRTSQLAAPLLETLDEFLDQAQQHDLRRELLEDFLAIRSNPASEEQRAEIAFAHNLAAHTASTQNRHDDARAHYQSYLEFQKAAGLYAATATTYRQLGIIALEQHRLDEAEEAYQSALKINLELGQRHDAAISYHELGILALERKNFEKAEEAFRHALETFIEVGDRRGEGMVYHELGILAQQQERFDEAEAAYEHAIDIRLEYGETRSVANAYLHIGMIAEARRQPREAEAAYHDALDIYLDIGDMQGQANVYHQLGKIAQEEQRVGEAEDLYRRAVGIHLEVLPRAISVSGASLATLLTSLGRHSEAIEILLLTAKTLRQETGQWNPRILNMLRKARSATDSSEFDSLARANMPDHLIDELAALEWTSFNSDEDGLPKT